MKDMTLDPQQKCPSLNRFSNLIRSIWLLTSEFPISDEEVERRSVEWSILLGPNFFDKWDKYVLYLIQHCCQSRDWRGPIHADEFYRIFYRVCVEKQVYSFVQHAWISEDEAMEAILAIKKDWSSLYETAELMSDDDAMEQILNRCRAIIYGWED